MRDLNELRRKAEEARDGWEKVHPMAAQRVTVGIGTDISHRLNCAPDAVREYAASARPTVVLALLDRLERAEAEAASLRGLLTEAVKALEPFASQAVYYDPDEGDGELPVWDFEPKTRELRTARTVATKIEEALK